MKLPVRPVMALTAVLVVGLAIGPHLRDQLLPLLPSAQAAGGKVESPTGTAPDRYVYYPGTEELGPDEMRVTACGTGMPAARHGQAATCFLVELGNGDKFIFDIGSSSAERLSALKIPMDYLDKLFIGHLHSDHIGAIAALWIGGVIGNRIRPLRVWGRSGHKPECGTAYAMARLEAAGLGTMTHPVGSADAPGREMAGS